MHCIKSFLLMLVEASFDQKRLPVFFTKAVAIPEYQEVGNRISNEVSFSFLSPHKPSDCEKNALRGSYLQCTTIGPASGGLQVLTLRKKARKGVGCSGTPWSGQAVNWNCLTSLFSLEPFCEVGTLAEILCSYPQVVMMNNNMQEVTQRCAILIPSPTLYPLGRHTLEL